MCEHFVARADQAFRIDALFPFAEKLERYGIAGFGWGAAWIDGEGRLASHRDVRAFRDDPGRAAIGPIETRSLLIHLRRPSRLSTLTLADTQPFDDPAGRFAFSHNGDLRDYRARRRAYQAAGRIHGRADTEVGERWLEDAWRPDLAVPDLAKPDLVIANPDLGMKGPAWRLIEAGPSVGGVWGSGPNDIYAIGGYGVILHSSDDVEHVVLSRLVERPPGTPASAFVF